MWLNTLSAIFGMMMLGDGGMLDVVSPDAYWAVREVKDNSAPAMMALAADAPRENDPAHPYAAQTRRLMAIRTLGERRERQAIETLNKLVDSKEPFIGEYARRALARIDGKALTPPDLPRAMAADLRLLSGECRVVGQVRRVPGLSLSLQTILGGALARERPEDVGRAMRRATSGVVEAIEQSGNFRLDGMTVGATVKRGDKGECMWMLLRGTGLSHLPLLNMGDGSDTRMKEVDGVKVYTPAPPKKLPICIAPSDDLVILVIPEESTEDAAVAETVAAIKAGRAARALEANASIAGLMRSIDTTSPVWAASDSFDGSDERWETAFATVTCEAKLSAAGLELTIKARGKEAKRLAEVVRKLQTDLAEFRDALAEKCKDVPRFGVVVEVLRAVKFEVRDTTATLKVNYEGNPAELMQLMLTPELWRK